MLFKILIMVKKKKFGCDKNISLLKSKNNHWSREERKSSDFKVYLGLYLSEVKSLRNCDPFLYSFLVSFIHSFHKYLLTTICASGTILDD